MKVVRLLPIGLLVTGVMSVGAGCGEDASSSTSQTSADLVMPKLNPFEAKVRQKNLASDAQFPDLLNVWGLAFVPRVPGIWLSVNGSGTAQLFTEDGFRLKKIGLGVDDPTGVVFNGTRAFKGDDLIFASESGIIVGMQGDGSNATPRFTAVDGAVYKGIAIATVHGKPRLFATDFHNGKIDIFDGDYQPIDIEGKVLKDPNLPNDPTRGTFAPFNVLGVGDDLIVSFAIQDSDAHDDVRGAGNGVVDIFEADGSSVQRLLTGPGQHPELSSPWALQLSAERNERGSIDLMIGNFGSVADPPEQNPELAGRINVYELSLIGKHVSAQFEGNLADKNGAPLQIDGLWGFIFGNGRAGFGRDDIYFGAGPNDEDNGLFGELDFISPRR